MIAFKRSIILTFLYFSSYILNSHVECREWQRQVLGELLGVNGNYDQAIEEHKDRMNGPQSIVCPELNNVLFTNDYPNHVIGVPECGDKQRIDIDLYVHGDFWPCRLVHFNLPNPANAHCFIKLRSSSNLRKIVVIPQGHGSLQDQGSYAKIRDNIFSKEGDNVAIIAVNYGYGQLLNSPNMVRTVANSRYTSYASYMMIKDIYQELDKAGKHVRMQCVGHSLGAQICGNIGKLLYNDKDPAIKMLETIIALDPFGPIFHNDNNIFNYNNPIEARLNKNDAEAVLVWHTDGRSTSPGIPAYGTMERAGHMDLYPGHGERYGYDMPGCGIFSGISGCSHQRAMEYYSVSIDMKNCFKVSKRCEGDPRGDIPRRCTPVGYGEDFSVGYWQGSENMNGMFTVEVMANYPYCA